MENLVECIYEGSFTNFQSNIKNYYIFVMQ